MKVKNNIIQDLINRCTYAYIILFKKKKEKKILNKISPLFIGGMFRSGTTITTQLIEKLGYDIGPQNHLLHSKGSRKKLNPSGFYENYFFMDWSLITLYKLNSWGDNPPSIEQVNNVKINIDYKEFVYHSVVNIHDDRISNCSKAKVLKSINNIDLNKYVGSFFKEKCAIKNPHFTVLYPLLNRYFTDAKYLVVFRNPIDTINSAKSVTPNANFELYYKYYKDITKNNNTFFFDYDTLIESPEKSIAALVKLLSVTEYPTDIQKMIKGKSKPLSDNTIVPEKINQLHLNLKAIAINN